MTVFVSKGDAPLTDVQLEKRAQKHIAKDWPEQDREKSIRTGDGAFDAFMVTFSANHTVNVENNTFNWQLSEYRKATARLEKCRLADGKPEETIETPAGQYDDEGNEIMDVTVIAAIEPLDAQVEETTYDEEGNVTGTTMVDNPLIVQDDAERAAAQAVVDGTPDEVKGFVGSN
tara:strand:+ start:1507 stop:2028 length:522 start_codon:yes stop_codon:yes gene_type:complete